MKRYLIDDLNLMKEYDFEKNKNENPSLISHGSEKKLWWKCANGHSYRSIVSGRFKGVGCPICKNKQVLKGYNDLATTHPNLLKIWNYEKNTITPFEVTGISGKKVWWKCAKGHEWQSTIAHISYGRRCPICNKETSTSFPEQAIYYYFLKQEKDILNRHKFLGKYEIDIFIPSKNIAIEYDGERWHTSLKKESYDLKKEKIFIKNNLTLYRIKEINKNKQIISKFYKEDNTYYCNNDDILNLELIIKDLIKIIFNKTVNINIECDRDIIYQNYIQLEKKNSLLSNSQLLKMWDYAKNQNLLPEYFKPKSEKIVWWKCSKGHSFKSAIHIMSDGKECPICKKERIFENSLYKTNPNIANEWNYEKNYPLTPNEFTNGSNKKVWWICSKGHEWQAVIRSRLSSNCPICSNRKIIKGINDLFTTNPELMKEWDYLENNKINLKSDNINAGSGKKANWICSKCGYKWKSIINSRAIKGTGCPICSKDIISFKTKQNALRKGINLSSIDCLVKEWDYDKNSTKPDYYTINSVSKVWWICSKGHSYNATIVNRTKGTGCPYCKNKKVLVGYNDLLTTNPSLAAEWNYEKNKGLTPKNFTKGSNKKVWWICKNNHEWEARINDRNKGNKCPICKNKKTQVL